jgi:3-hydroxyisobutyrate dehydrogenase
MGLPMSRRLVEAGHNVVGYDLSVQARRRAAGFGVREMSDVGDAVADVELIILMLPDSDAVTAVLSDDALLGRIAPQTIVIDMSSSEPLRTRVLAGSLKLRGIRLLDAPVSGGVLGAENGKLTIMAGGDKAVLDLARPCLEPLGTVIHTGPVGSGHAVKSLNNLLSATHLWITSEAMLAGVRFGIDPEVMLSVFNGSSGRSGSTENKWPKFVLPGTYNSGFGLRLMVKDMGIAVQLAEEVGAPSVLGSEALELWRKAAQGLPPSADHTEIVRWLEGEGGANDN